MTLTSPSMAPINMVAIANIKYEPQVGRPYSAIKVECKTFKKKLF